MARQWLKALSPLVICVALPDEILSLRLKASSPLAGYQSSLPFVRRQPGSFRPICSRSENCPANLISFAGGAGPGDGGLDLNYQLAERNRGPALLGASQGHSRLYPLSLVDLGHAPERTRSFAIHRNDLRSGSWNTRHGRFLDVFRYGQRLRRPYLYPPVYGQHRPRSDGALSQPEVAALSHGSLL